MIKKYGLILFLLGLFPILAAAQGEISITARVDRASITIGDLITYSVTITRDPDINVELPALGENLGQFEIRDYTVHKPRKAEGKVIDQVDYIISTFDTGEFTIPPVKISYSISGNQEIKNLRTENIQINVVSVKSSEAGDIREIKPPWEIPRSLKMIFLIGGIALVVILAFLGVILYVRKRRQNKTLVPQRMEPPRPPHELAIQKLKQLAASDLLDKGRIKKFYSEISEIIRIYIEGRFNIIAIELTTFELLEGMESVQLPDDIFSVLEKFLTCCDLVKFAQYKPLEKEHEQVKEWAYQIVDSTKEEHVDV